MIKKEIKNIIILRLKLIIINNQIHFKNGVKYNIYNRIIDNHNTIDSNQCEVIYLFL